MTDAERLLAEATPLPWQSTHSGPWNAAIIDPLGIDIHYADAALIVYAVNHLPDYLAAVEALERARPYVEECIQRGIQLRDDGVGGAVDIIVGATESVVEIDRVLARLRDEVPA